EEAPCLPRHLPEKEVLSGPQFPPRARWCCSRKPSHQKRGGDPQDHEHRGGRELAFEQQYDRERCRQPRNDEELAERRVHVMTRIRTGASGGLPFEQPAVADVASVED